MKIENYIDLVKFLTYDKDTGIFRWAIDMPTSVKKGSIAGNRNKFSGYRRVTILGNQYAEHRLAWLYSYGEMPSLEIDHINGVRDDNRIDNLRLATRKQNLQHSVRKNNTGVVGAAYSKEHKKYRVRINVEGKRLYLGAFKTAEEAGEVYKQASIKYFGEFSVFYRDKI